MFNHSKLLSQCYARLMCLTSLLLAANLMLAACGEASPTIAPSTALPPAITQLATSTTSQANPTNPTKNPTVIIPPTTVTPKLSKGTLSQIFPSLTNLADTTTSFRIEDDWTGMGFGFSHTIAHYDLQRQSSQEFTGTVVFRVGDYPDPHDATCDILIPADKARAFLQAITTTPMEEGPLKPQNTHTDDYPNYNLIIQVGSNPLVISSMSQERNRVPWTVSFLGHQYAVYSDVPTQALDNLKPFLAKEVLTKLEDDVSHAPRATEAPTPNPLATPTPTAALKSSILTLKYSILAQPGHISSVNVVSFSPDGKMFASAGYDMTVRLWEMPSGKLLKILKGHSGGVLGLSFSPNGKTLASSSADNTIRLWDTNSGNQLNVFKYQGNDEYGWAVAFTPDGKTLISSSGTRDNTIKFWEVSSGKVKATLKGGSESNLILSANGQILASGDQVWDLTTNKELPILDKLRGIVVALSADGQLLAFGSRSGAGQPEDTTIKLIEVATGKERAVLKGSDSNVDAATFSPDSKFLISSDYKSLKLWDVSSGQEITAFSSKEDYSRSVAFSPDGKTILTGTVGGNIQAWNAISHTEMFTIPENTSLVHSIAFSSDNKIFATGNEDGTVKLWDKDSGHAISTFKGHTAQVNAVAFSPDGKLLASGSGYDWANGNSFDNTVKIWDVSTGKVVATLNGHTATVWSVAFSPDGKTLASGSSDRTIRLWNVATGKQTAILRGQVPEFYEFFALAFSPDGKTLAGAGGGDTQTNQYPVKLWDVGTGRELPTNFKAHTAPVRTLAFSSNGKFLASAGDNNVIKLWDVIGNKEYATLKGYFANTSTITFSPDAKLLASAHPNGLLMLWNISGSDSVISETEIEQTERDRPFSIAFSPDGKYLVSGHLDSAVKLWQLGL